MIIEGYYQYPGRAAQEAARVTLGELDASLVLARHDAGSQAFMLAQVEVSQALGSIPLTLTFPDGGRFRPADDALFRAWVAQHKPPGLVYRLEKYKRGALFTLLATVLVALSYVYVVLPWLSATVALHIPTAVEQQLGEHTLALLERTELAPSTLPEARQQALQRLFEQAQPPEMRQERTPLRLRLMSAPDIGPNAFMLADGTLIVSDELVKLSRHDDGLVAVMLHEMGHHAYRHSMRMLVRSSLVSLTFMWVTGDVSGVGDTLLQSAAFVNELQFSRDMEREADAWAIAEMQRQGRSLQAMQDIYQQLMAASEKEHHIERIMPDWLSTHPDMQQRLDAIKAHQK